MNATIFNKAGNQLLQLTCKQMLQEQNLNSLLSIKNKQIKLQVQAQIDNRTGITRCTVDNTFNPKEQPPTVPTRQHTADNPWNRHLLEKHTTPVRPNPHYTSSKDLKPLRQRNKDMLKRTTKSRS
ncbi:hypothetical protein M8C21_023361 [Ambrosia artemisiifolia]|uniref:Uncharacterized protein n=1 Tax=Ambrosia artemisiifolia TaxID=4212 RepID=A0AAD5GN92_AMBAR|nr:hypothetical protein M8C21_023361 [Ambrosia artemisiifolia]